MLCGIFNPRPLTRGEAVVGGLVTAASSRNPATLIQADSSRPNTWADVGPRRSCKFECPFAKAGQKMSKLPLPDLQKTLELFLKSSKPLLNCSEFCESDEIVKKFGAAGGQGEHLQSLLKERANRLDNWLNEYWINFAYLDKRNPLAVHSNPAQVFPKQRFCHFSDMIKCSTNIAMAALRFKQMVDKGMQKRDVTSTNEPLDMHQYQVMFGGTRIPFSPGDRVVCKPDAKHIVLIHKDGIYRLDVMDKGQPISKAKLYGYIEAIVMAPFCPSPPLGVLSSENRDHWCVAYDSLRKDFQNRTSLKIIEDSLFALCIDDKIAEVADNAMTTSAEMIFHGGGPSLNGTNRWYDKSLQLIVGPDGSAGINFENSSIGGMAVAVLTDYIVEYLKNDPEPMKEPSVPPCEIPEKLGFNISDCIQDMISKAQSSLDRNVSDLDFCAFSFDTFGKDKIKKHGLSPDSFVQMALQLAFYRTHKEPCAQDELGTLRKFHLGRSDSIRGCSEESVRFVQALCNQCISCEAKASAVRLAVDSHRHYAVSVNNGRGCDRHLLALMKIAEETGCGVPDIFNCPAYRRSTYIRMSASKMIAHTNSFMVYAPAVADGYACWYNARENNINFATSTFASYPGTCAVTFKDAVENALNDMRDVLDRAPAH